MKPIKIAAARSLVLAFIVLAAVPADVDAAGEKVTIAVVRDGPSDMNEIVDQIRPELDHLMGSDFEVTFDLSDAYDAQWNPQLMRRVIESALSSRDVDLILGVGTLVTYEAMKSDLELSKPFVSATLLDGDIPKLDFRMDRTLKDNLCLVVQSQRTDTEVQLINRLLKARRIHLVLSRELFDRVPEIKPALDAYGREVGVEIIPLLVADDWGAVMDQLTADVEMVLFESTPRLPRRSRAAFVAAVNERMIPTFSGVGPADLELGMLATNRPDMNQSLSRRVALNIFQLLTGSATDDLPVMLISDSQLMINGRTAAEIGFPLSFEARILGTLLHPEALEAGADSLALRDVLVMTESGNVELSISNQEVETVLRSKQVIRSPMFPQIDAVADYNNFDNNLVGTLVPEQFARVNLGISQMIFDDELISNFRSADRAYEAVMYQNESDRLDVYLNAEAAYLRFVQARLLYTIVLNNLRLTEGNLDIAKMRVEVGHSGRDEVFRWTAEVNQQRTLVMDVEALMEVRRIRLNQILGVDQGKRWRPEPVDENADWFQIMREKLSMVFESQSNFDRFTEAFVEIAREYSPEMKFLVKNIEAEDIQLGQRKRSFIVPKFYLGFDYNYNFWQTPEQPELDSNMYEFRVTAALPLFEGTRRLYDMKLSKSLLIELERRLELADQLVEERTRNALRQIQASLPNIGYSRVAAENALKNFVVVRDKYANGIVNITDVLEAQNASFGAEQDALVSLYAFLLDSANFQRAVSFFPDTKDQNEIDRFVNYMREKVEALEAQEGP